MQNVDFNPKQMDFLREIGNIGAGHAATSLSALMSRKVDMTVPKVKFLDFNEIATLVGGPETIVLGILVRISDGINGMMMFLIEESFAHSVLNSLMELKLESFEQFGEMEISAMKEIGNIMASSYVTALSDLTHLSIDISPPDLAIDMAAALLSTVAIEFSQVGDKVLFIEKEFIDDVGQIKNYVLFIPEMESLKKIMNIFGL